MANTEDTSVARVAFRAPPFWENNAHLWFLQIESSFILSNITSDETKYHSVVAALDPKVLNYVADILSDPPAKDAYKAIKDRILQHYTQSETARLRQLLQEVQLGDSRPSQLLLQMRALAGLKVEDTFLKSLWLQRLPVNVQQILSTCNVDLNNLANIADKVCEVSSMQPNELSAVSSSANLIEQLRDEIKALATEVAELKKSCRAGRSANFSRSHSRNRNRSRSSERNTYCWYHDRFRDKAKKCIEPCAWSKNAQMPA